MNNANRTTPTDQWTSAQAYVLAVVCLLVGVAGGWFIRGSQPPVSDVPAESASAAPFATMGTQQMPSPERMKQMAATQAAPLLDKLKSDPGNPELLANIRSEEHTSELQSRLHLVCRLLLEKKNRARAPRRPSRAAGTPGSAARARPR